MPLALEQARPSDLSNLLGRSDDGRCLCLRPDVFLAAPKSGTQHSRENTCAPRTPCLPRCHCQHAQGARLGMPFWPPRSKWVILGLLPPGVPSSLSLLQSCLGTLIIFVPLRRHHHPRLHRHHPQVHHIDTHNAPHPSFIETHEGPSVGLFTATGESELGLFCASQYEDRPINIASFLQCTFQHAQYVKAWPTKCQQKRSLRRCF